MVPGLSAAQLRFGKLRLEDVLDPAIELASKGFLVTPTFHAASVSRLDALRANPAAAEIFLRCPPAPAPSECDAIPVGERLVQADLAKTLQRIKKIGARDFTHGTTARMIGRESKRLGGVLQFSDLKRFRARFREPLAGTYRGRKILTMPPPSSGGTHLLQMLSMLEIDREKRGRSEPPSVDDEHMLIEIMRRAYADRAVFMGDPAFVDIPLPGLLARDYLGARYATIDPAKASTSKSVTAGAPGDVRAPKVREAPIESHDTTHISVIDAEGNAVALTQTINTSFGACVVVPETGVLLNNQMDDFASAPGAPNAYGLVGGEANSIQPGKIPLSSMTPTIVLEDGSVRLIVGASGGPTIITTVLQIILGVFDREMDVATAVAAPKLHMQWLPDETTVEANGLAERIRRALVERGHHLVEQEGWGNATAILVTPDGTRIGAADPRGEGAGDAQ
jgi:gamma-glutamyltranspeptidase/glutathione hydrolase